MTIEEAIPLRHSVRQYQPTPLTPEQVEKVQNKISELNEAHGLSMQLILNDDEAFNSRMAHYGSFRGVRNFVAVVGPKNPTLSERAGHALAQLILYVQTLGLNTCIAAMTFKKTANINICDGEAIVVAIALGVGQTQGVQHSMKPASRIAPGYDNAPDWFKKGIDTVLMAPSAINQFRATFVANEDGSVTAKARLGLYTKVDLGIFKYYFELGAGTENFRWK